MPFKNFKMRTLLVAALMLAGLTVRTTAAQEGEAAMSGPVITVSRFLPTKPISRAERSAPVSAQVHNGGNEVVTLHAELVLPPGVHSAEADSGRTLTIAGGETQRLDWELEAREAISDCRLRLTLNRDGNAVAEADLVMDFLEPVEVTDPGYIPPPEPVHSPLLVGAHHCPLWEAAKPEMWANIIKHPERTPALGFYDQANPEISDWETKWAAEHGIDFFIYCWYRTSQGGPVETMFSSAIHEAFFKSRYQQHMKFTIMWENQRRGIAGVADETDLMENLMPYWMEHYFKHDSYLVVDNKPVLFIYRPEFLVDDLGGIENVPAAFEKMRQYCRDAGFDGLYLLGEYRGLDGNHLQHMKDLGLDYTFAYCWHIQDNPTPERAIRTQMEYIQKTEELGILPQVVTVSQAWSGWRDEGSIWKIPPKNFETLLSLASEFVGSLPEDTLSGRMLLLDNWNEWGEGHYIAPYREYGFGYVDAVRNVLTDADEPHTDLIPEDIGMGPYDTAYWEWAAKQDKP